jgi:hypothetical protein
MNDHESVAMWKMYLKSDQGVAIQSTAQRLKDCLATSRSDLKIGEVEYLDYDTDILTDPIFCKRKSLVYERELRAYIFDGEQALSDAPPPPGLTVSVDLDALVEKIYVSPTAEKWSGLVRGVCADYGLAKHVVNSRLLDPSLY